jgi:hypothetical protein
MMANKERIKRICVRGSVKGAKGSKTDPDLCEIIKCTHESIEMQIVTAFHSVCDETYA